MNKQPLKQAAAMAAATWLLCACAAQRLPEYDQRPDNVKPILQQPQAQDYNINDTKTFALYTNPYSLARADGIYLMGMAYYRLYRAKEATYVTATYQHRKKKFYYFNSNCAIIDSRTGDQYMMRRLEHFPTDTFFWVDGVDGNYVRFVLVFPPLPESVKTVDFFAPSGPSRRYFSGEAKSKRKLSVKKLRRGNGKVPERMVSRRGRIIY